MTSQDADKLYKCARGRPSKERVRYTLVSLLLGLTMTAPAYAQRSLIVDTLPVLEIPGVSRSGQLLFERPAGATRLSDGTIVVADGTGGTVRFFDISGRPIRTVGRKGFGPGEFQLLSWLGRCGGDSVFVWDFLLTRLTNISPRGGIVRQYRLPLRGNGPAPYLLSCSPTGVFALLNRPVYVDRGHEHVAETGRGTSMLVLADGSGNVLRNVGEVLSHEWVVALGGGAVPRPLGRTTAIALSSSHLYVGTGESPSIDMYSLTGSERDTLRFSSSQRRPTRIQFEQAASELVGYAPDAAARQAMRKRLVETPVPTYLPVYSGLFVDSDAVVWIVLSHAVDSFTELLAIDASQSVVSRARIPAALTVFEVGRDYVLAGHQDSSGQPSVRLYRVRRT